MKTLLRILVMCLICSAIGYTQNTNPFEIQNRLDSNVLSSGQKLNSDQHINPFEINPISQKKTHTTGPKLSKQKQVLGGTQKGNVPLIVFIVSLILIFIAVQSSRTLIPILYTALINENQSRILQKEFTKFSILHTSLYTIFIGNLALLLCYLLDYQFGVAIWGLFVWLFFGIIVVYLSRHFIMRLLVNIFPFGSELHHYDFNITHAHIALSLLLFISNLLLAYSNTGNVFLWVGIGLWLVFSIHRVFRGILVGLRYRQINLFHFFMYLCAFEIAPNFSLLHFAKTSVLGS